MKQEITDFELGIVRSLRMENLSIELVCVQNFRGLLNCRVSRVYCSSISS